MVCVLRNSKHSLLIIDILADILNCTLEEDDVFGQEDDVFGQVDDWIDDNSDFFANFKTQDADEEQECKNIKLQYSSESIDVSKKDVSKKDVSKKYVSKKGNNLGNILNDVDLLPATSKTAVTANTIKVDALNCKLQDENDYKNIQFSEWLTPIEEHAINQTMSSQTPKANGFQLKHERKKEIKESNKFQQARVDALPHHEGFKTASNKSIKISEKNSRKAASLLQDLPQMPKLIRISNEFDCIAEFQDFKTASNKTITISEENNKKAASSLQAWPKMPRLTRISTDFDSNAQFQGFQTASNNTIKISEENSRKAARLLQDLPKMEALQASPPNISNNCSKILEKGVQVSNHLPSKKANFKDDVCNTEACMPSFIGFQTASNKPIPISEETKRKVHAMFKDIIDLEEKDVLGKYLIYNFTNVHAVEENTFILHYVYTFSPTIFIR